MDILFSLILNVLHFIYSAVLKLRSFRQRHSQLTPQHLLAERRRIPKHLALLFVAETGQDVERAKHALSESVLNAVEWCRAIGVQKLTVYEEKDLLSQCIADIQQGLPKLNTEEESPTAQQIYHPLTPPPSDYSDSRPLSPNNGHYSIPFTAIHISGYARHEEFQDHSPLKLRQHFDRDVAPKLNDLLLCLVSRESSKPAVAATAQAIAQTQRNRSLRTSRSQKGTQFALSVEELDKLLEDEDGLSSPDFMIVHHLRSPRQLSTPLELYGFPPWHVRLTELYHSQPHVHRTRTSVSPQEPHSLDETTFREALDEFATAEMRFGK
ncbi:hypothetical protein CPB83DRAFT_754001 [Crepidotus variabilis]|uniref:ditrans,polycis-polyprenyl diphosphate synthase [(2E,6E)-farnesyldiphosphate specific] n=1 Tax=Crepidotus variabilis TaxID=179855 RepID=A0A9P6JVH2_9AGAR|nr:hypothetical protein CPB83DRAFT_754001 [Crepidotus variabilis]